MSLKTWFSADPERRNMILFVAAAVLFALAMFRILLSSGAVLFTTDDNVGWLAFLKSSMPRSLWGYWDDRELLGAPVPLRVGLTTVLIWLLPAKFVANWIHAIHLVAGSVFLALFLRRKNIGWPACALAALTAYWVGSNFTLTYAGHIWKFGVVAFAAAFLWLVEHAVQTRRTVWGFIGGGIIAGGAMGLMFLEMPDVALFFSVLLGPYAVFAFAREHGWDMKRLAAFLAGIALTAGLLAFNPFWTARQLNLTDSPASAGGDRQREWEYATQWSWPPEETIDFIAPGFTGWRSGEETGPYYGRMGRSAGWEQTRQGFQNFKLENQYLGAIPLVAAAFAGYLAWRRRRERTAWNADVFFWGAVSLVALLLAFGKHFILYRLFYLLPMVSGVRNPNKFLQVLQLTLAILAAYGLDAATKPAADPRRARPFVRAAFALGAVLGLWVLMSVASWGSLAARFSEFGVLADTIVRNRCWAIGQAAVMTLAAAALLGYLLRPPRKGVTRPRWVVWVAVVLVAADALALARHYIKPLPKSLIAENDFVRFLKSDRSFQRVSLVQQTGFYNAWLTYLFPYYQIQTLNAAQVPRMAADYQAFLGALGPQPIRLWQLAAVGRVLGPSGLWGQVQNDPKMKGLFDLIFAYNVTPDPDGGVAVTPPSQANPGQHVVIGMKLPSPRYALIRGWTTKPDEEALRTLASPGYVPYSQVILSPNTPGPVPESPETGPEGSVGVKQYAPGYARLQVSVETPAILRAADKYDPGWKATIDGKPAPVLKCDYLFQGVYIPPGLHEVVLEYAPSPFAMYVQIAGLGLVLLAILDVVLRKTPAPAA